MTNMSLKKNIMPMQDPKERIHNFNEVALGYNEELAIDEANRCLHCNNHPCIDGCPVNINIPKFIEKIKDKDFEGAYNVISLSSSLASICGRVCPQETQCEEKCIRGIKGEPVAIGRLERFVADNHLNELESNVISFNEYRIAIVGSGPSGIACAFELINRGYHVTVYEALHKAGGVLVYGIPEFRLPKKIVEKEIKKLEDLGVEFKTNVVIGKTITIEELLNEFDAVYIGTGAGLPMFMGIPGESLNGVYSANEFLTRANLMKAYSSGSATPIKKDGIVVVVGGGNVAMDAARTALRLDAKKVYIVYRRSIEELPARKEEVEHAKEEGIEFKLLTNPVEIIGYKNNNDPKDLKNGSVVQIKCIKMELGEPDERGRRRPIEIPNSEFVIDADCVIMALGTSPNPLIRNTTKDLEISKRGGIVVDENEKTSIDRLYAGGDAVTGAATVISAMGAGKKAAIAIDKLLNKKI